MKNWIILFLGFYVVSVNAQDRIINREIEYDPDIDQTLKILRTNKDTIFYSSNGKQERIATKDVIAFKRNYKESKASYYYPNPEDERIYGIRNDILYIKKNYENDAENPEIAREAYLERYRVYDVVLKNKKGNVFLEKKDKRKKLHKNVKLYVYLKSDSLNRLHKAKVFNIPNDLSSVIMRIGVNGEKHLYRFNSEDIKRIGMEPPVLFAIRHTLAAMVLSTGTFAWSSYYFYKKKWCRYYDFNEWKLTK